MSNDQILKSSFQTLSDHAQTVTILELIRRVEETKDENDKKYLTETLVKLGQYQKEFRRQKAMAADHELSPSLKFVTV